MSELKVASLFELEKVLQGRSNKLFYSKSEVDNVIADLLKQLRHSNYKRCLDNAEACKHKRWRNDDEGFDFARSHRQMLKWLELADKLKG